MTVAMEFKEFNIFITLYSQTLAVVTVEYDGRSLNETKWKAAGAHGS